MTKNLQLNADRFQGFANSYDNARPQCPQKVKDIIVKYLGSNPSIVVDLGCGTGLSTVIWSGVSNKVIGIEPSTDMIETAKEKSSGLKNVEYISAFSDNTGLDNSCADVVTCSQAFHWMDPQKTLNEVSRILREGGVFAVYDCDWPPFCNWEAEFEYQKLFDKVYEIEEKHPDVKDSFVRWDKNKHLENIKKYGDFRFEREIVFSNPENCNANRFIEIALSQGGLQKIIKSNIEEIKPYMNSFKEKIHKIFGETEFTIDFCYRMRIGIK